MKCWMCKQEKNYFGEMHNIIVPGGEHRGKVPVCEICLGWNLKKGEPLPIGYKRLLIRSKKNNSIIGIS